MVRVQTLHRRDAGTTALIVLRDTRWRSDVSIIGTMEIGLSSGTQLVYIAPNLMFSIHDFLHHIELVIMTHGYDEWQGGESNLLITRALVARLTNTSQTSFRYNISGVANYLASHGISAIPGRRHTITELQGRSWNLRPFSTTMALLVPTILYTHQRLDGSLRLSFSIYNPQPLPPEIPTPYDSHEFALFIAGDEPHWDLSDPEPAHFISDPNEDPFSDLLYLYNYLSEHLLPDAEGGGFTTEPVAEPVATVACPAVAEIAEEPVAEPVATTEALIWNQYQNNHPYVGILGQPSGKYDYLVYYTPPAYTSLPNISIKPTGWGDEPSSPSSPNSTSAPTQTCFTLQNHLEELDYPQLKKMVTKAEKLYASVSSNYLPPNEPVMGPVNYPPTTSLAVKPDASSSYPFQ